MCYYRVDYNMVSLSVERLRLTIIIIYTVGPKITQSPTTSSHYNIYILCRVILYISPF